MSLQRTLRRIIRIAPGQCVSLRASAFIALLVLGQAYAQAQDHDFKLGDSEIQGKWSTTLTLGTAVRTRHPDRALIGRSFGTDGKPKGGISQSNATDDGDANYPTPWKPYSTPVKLFSDIRLTYKNYGFYLSGNAWYDDTLENRDVPQGNIPNGMRNAPLSDESFEKGNRFKAVQLLGAYVYGHWNMGGGALDVRAGKQNIPWGGTLFYQGVSYVNPVDFTALQRPGTDPQKEGLVPTEMLYGKFDFNKNFSMDAFYQLKWRPSNIAGCGTFWSAADFGMAPSCRGIPLDTFYGPLAAEEMPASASRWYNDNFGLYMEQTPARNASNSGQYGLAAHWNFDSLHGKLDMYWMNVGSRVPLVSTTNWDAAALNTPNAALLAAGAPERIAVLASGLSTMHIRLSYPDDVKVMGLSYSALLRGWTIGGEVSHTRGLPVQLNPVDLMLAVQHIGPLAPRIEGAPPLAPFRGYDRLNKTQLVLNAKRAFNGMLGADASAFAGEVMFSHADNLPPLSSVRYLRGFQYGFANPNAPCVQATNPLLGLVADCLNEGFATRFAWGYRLRWQLNYTGSSGMTWSPVLMWAHDVNGNSIDSQLLDERKIATLGIKFNYRKKYFGDLSYGTRLGGATYDVFGDRDFLSLGVGMNF